MRSRCTKKKFRDEIAAKLALAKIQYVDSGRRESDEKRTYFHKVCNAWHLTSQPLRERVSV